MLPFGTHLVQYTRPRTHQLETFQVDQPGRPFRKGVVETETAHLRLGTIMTAANRPTCSCDANMWALSGSIDKLTDRKKGGLESPTLCSEWPSDGKRLFDTPSDHL